MKNLELQLQAAYYKYGTVSYLPDDIFGYKDAEMTKIMQEIDDIHREILKGGASDYHDPNPIEAEHVYLLMAKNFPPDAIQWVKRARWVGPVWVPWDRIDTDNKDSWAASHQQAKVSEFKKLIQVHQNRISPSILVQEAKSGKAFIVDGHHRAVAHEQLGQKVLSYLGNIDPKDRQAALETHTKQIHSGTDPENK